MTTTTFIANIHLVIRPNADYFSATEAARGSLMQQFSNQAYGVNSTRAEIEKLFLSPAWRDVPLPSAAGQAPSDDQFYGLLNAPLCLPEYARLIGRNLRVPARGVFPEDFAQNSDVEYIWIPPRWVCIPLYSLVEESGNGLPDAQNRWTLTAFANCGEPGDNSCVRATAHVWAQVDLQEAPVT